MRMVNRFLLVVGLLACSVFAFAQGDGGEDGGIDLKGIVAMVIVGILVPVLTQLIKPLWAKAPAFLKTLGPVVIVPALMTGVAYLSALLGVPLLDFGPLLEIFGGTAMLGIAATAAFKLGKLNPAGLSDTLKALKG